MAIATEDEYATVLLEHIRDSQALAREGTLFPLSVDMKRVSDDLERFRALNERYRIVCGKDHYAGGGVSYNAGDVYGYYCVRKWADDALSKLQLSDAEGCWSMIVDEGR